MGYIDEHVQKNIDIALQGTKILETLLSNILQYIQEEINKSRKVPTNQLSNEKQKNVKNFQKDLKQQQQKLEKLLKKQQKTIALSENKQTKLEHLQKNLEQQKRELEHLFKKYNQTLDLPKNEQKLFTNFKEHLEPIKSGLDRATVDKKPMILVFIINSPIMDNNQLVRNVKMTQQPKKNLPKKMSLPKISNPNKTLNLKPKLKKMRLNIKATRQKIQTKLGELAKEGSRIFKMRANVHAHPQAKNLKKTDIAFSITAVKNIHKDIQERIKNQKQHEKALMPQKKQNMER